MKADASHAYRYAVYFAPPTKSVWWEMGSQWLGRCAASQENRKQPTFDGIDPGCLNAVTAEPRRYGWHATLKAPFVLGDGVHLENLRSALLALAQSFSAFELPALRVRRLGDFLALCPERDDRSINAVADACVQKLHALSALPSADELKRRRGKGSLSAREDELLVQWGYPYVLEQYRFHQSLTGALGGVDGPTVDRLARAAQSWFENLPPCRFDGLSLFAEPVKGADFVLVERWVLRG